MTKPRVALTLRRVGDAFVFVAALILELVVWNGRPSVVGGVTLPIAVVPVTLTAVYALLFLRWRYPLRIFWVQWAFGVVCFLVPNCEPFAGVLIALHAVAGRRPLRPSLVAVVATIVMFALQSYTAAAQSRGGRQVGFLQILTLWAVICLMVWGLGRLSYTLSQREQRLQKLQLAEAIQAERLRLARELHDIVAHSVTVMILQASGARAVAGDRDDRITRSLSVIETAGVEAMAELHRLLELLRSVDPDFEPCPEASSSDEQPRLADLSRLVELAQASGQRVQVEHDGTSGPMDPSVELAAYRVVQESLTNVAKHAGVSSPVEIVLSWRPELLQLTVRNRVDTAAVVARSHDARLSSGHGLRGLAERVALVGGTFTAGPVPGGFEVVAQLPRSGSAVPQPTHDAAALR